MGKKLGGITWKSVALEGLPLDGSTLDGFVGLEECTDYDFDGKKEPKKKKNDKNKKELHKQLKSEAVKITQKRKPPIPQDQPVYKKTKLSNGFVVEDYCEARPSSNNRAKSPRITDTTHDKKKVGTQKTNNSSQTNEDQNKLTVEDMSAWAPYQVPEEILKALAEQGFDRPTKIQELCLPPAMLGRRDILGAAETGSGKTLSFGIPILAGIMKLKEKENTGENIYDVKFKKTSNKRKVDPVEKKCKKNRKSTDIKNKTVNKYNRKESDKDLSEADDSDKDENNTNETNGDQERIQNNVSESENDSDNDQNESGTEQKIIKENVDSNDNESGEDNNENDSDDNDENYIHLSDMIDSDDLADSSDEENDEIIDPNDSDTNESGDDLNESIEYEDVENSNEDIGCVKVIDDVEIPSPATMRTGKPLYALIITPTRELAMQISKHITLAAKYTGIRIATLVGGMAQVKQERVLSHSPEVVVCTPGRLWELLQQGNPHLSQVDSIKFLAIDETDRMVERNHFDELRPLLERMNADDARRAGRQNFVMSATLTMIHDLPTHMKGKKVTKRGKIINKKIQKMTPQQKIKKLITMIGMSDPKIVDLTADNHGKSGTLTECKVTCALEQKDHYLLYMLKVHPGRAIVFCNSIGCVKRLAQLFGLLQCRPLPLHAGMPQRQRLKNLERFRDNPKGLLIATDVAARGLDIPNVDHVIHYQVPRTAENYVHRSGRTARANKEGLTILMMEPGEAFLYTKICRTLDKTTDISELPVPDRVLSGLRQCVTLARQVEAAMLDNKRRAKETGWLEKAAKECDLVIDEDFVPVKKKQTSQEISQSSKDLQLKKKQLETLLLKPIFPKGFSYKYPTLNDPKSLVTQEESALATLKKVLETGAAKREKRASKNAQLLNLGKKFKPNGIGKRKTEKKSAPLLNLEKKFKPKGIGKAKTVKKKSV